MTFHPLVLAAAAALLAAPFPSNAKEVMGGCYAVVEGQTLVDYPCVISLEKGGSFSVSQNNGRVFIGVEVTGKGVGKAYYAEHSGNDDLVTEDLGRVRRDRLDGACWSGERARVCAR